MALRLAHTLGCRVEDLFGGAPSDGLAAEFDAGAGSWRTGRSGWVVAPGHPKQIRSALDLARPDVRRFAREPGAGARRWLDGELRVAGVPPRLARAAAPCASGHSDVARAVALGAGRHGHPPAWTPRAPSSSSSCRSARSATIRRRAFAGGGRARDPLARAGTLERKSPSATGDDVAPFAHRECDGVP